MTENRLEDYVVLTRLTMKLTYYRCLLQGAIAWFTYGMIVASAALLGVSVGSILGCESLIAAIAVAIAISLSFILVAKLGPRCVCRDGICKEVRYTREKYVLSFLLPFAIGYITLYILGSLGFDTITRLLYPISWFIFLAFALLMYHLLVERPMGMKPSTSLIGFIAFVVELPLLIYIDYMDPRAGAVMALGLMLFNYYICGIYLLYLARKVFE